MASADRPLLWLFAGPNGSGKSTFHQSLDVRQHGRSIKIINPDLLAAQIAATEGTPLSDANLQSVVRIEAWLATSIDAYQSVGAETVLSTTKYQRLVAAARLRQFEVRLTYVVLDAPDRSIARVRARVAKGGHAVPDEKIVDRYWRSLQHLPWFLRHSDKAWVYDNSGERPQLIGGKADGNLWVEESALLQIVEAVGKAAVHP